MISHWLVTPFWKFRHNITKAKNITKYYDFWPLALEWNPTWKLGYQLDIFIYQLTIFLLPISFQDCIGKNFPVFQMQLCNTEGNNFSFQDFNQFLRSFKCLLRWKNKPALKIKGMHVIVP